MIYNSVCCCSDGTDTWSDEVIDYFEEVTHCAKWRVVFAQSVDVKFSVRTVKLVDTSTKPVRVRIEHSKVYLA